MRLGTAWASVLALGCMLASSAAGASAPPVSVLKIEIENYVPYHYEVFDPSKFATGTDLTAAQPAIPFGQLIILGDIVAVNGRPVKGAWALRGTDLFLTPTVGVQPPNQPPQGRQAIADVQRGHIQDMIWDILGLDSNPIGTSNHAFWLLPQTAEDDFFVVRFRFRSVLFHEFPQLRRACGQHGLLPTLGDLRFFVPHALAEPLRIEELNPQLALCHAHLDEHVADGVQRKEIRKTNTSEVHETCFDFDCSTGFFCDWSVTS
jgi:hypothetical protein